MAGPLHGLIPAAHTPFGPDGRLNLDAVAGQAQLFREMGIEHVFIGGTTGEFSSLTLDERFALAERWGEVAGGLIGVAVHVGDNAVSNAVALARHAKASGATSIALTAPSYFKPTAIADLIDFCEPVAAAADPLAFYFYDIPAMTGVRVKTSEFLSQARRRIPTLRGLKFSNYDFLELQDCIRVDGGAFDVFFGSDECLLAGLSLGIRGAVGSTYNFASPVYRKLITAFENRDFEAARALQYKSIDLIKTLAEYGFVAASKCVMAMLGVDCGPVRTPLRPLTAAQQVEIWERISPLDIFPRPLRRPAST